MFSWEVLCFFIRGKCECTPGHTNHCHDLNCLQLIRLQTNIKRYYQKKENIHIQILKVRNDRIDFGVTFITCKDSDILDRNYYCDLNSLPYSISFLQSESWKNWIEWRKAHKNNITLWTEMKNTTGESLNKYCMVINADSNNIWFTRKIK